MALRPSIGRYALAAITSAAVAGLSCDDTPAPTYPVQDAILRLIPESDTIGSDGGPVFVLVELTRTSDAGKPSAILYASAESATIDPLPGPALCQTSNPIPPEGGAEAAAGADAEADAGGVGAVEAGAPLAQIVIPYAALATDSVRTGVRETGLVVRIPQGSTDALIVASAYSHNGADDSCDPSDPTLIAVASARITRTQPEAAVDAPAPQGDAMAPTGDAGETDSTMGSNDASEETSLPDANTDAESGASDAQADGLSE